MGEELVIADRSDDVARVVDFAEPDRVCRWTPTEQNPFEPL